MKKIARSLRFKVAFLVVLAVLLFQAAERLIEADNTNPKRKRGFANGSSFALRVGVTVEDIVFLHAKHVSRTDLDEMTKDVQKGQPMNPAANRKAARTIQDFLKNRKGRYWASVTLEEGSEVTDRRVIFNISEGPVLRVRSTEFVGGESLASPARLRSQIQTSPAFMGNFGGPYTTVDDDVKKIEDYYRSFGYTDVKVFRELIFSADYSKVDVIFHIEEGLRTKIDKITITQPNSAFRDPELRSLLRLRPGSYFGEVEAEQDKHPLETVRLRGLTSRIETETKTADPAPLSLDDRLRELRQKIGQWHDEARSQGLREFLELDSGHLQTKIAPVVVAPPNAESGAASTEPHKSSPPMEPTSEKKAEDSSSEKKTESAPAKIDTDIIVEVLIKGNQTIDRAEILRYVRIRAGALYNKSQIYEDCDRLNNSRKFKDVRASWRKLSNGVQITFEVEEFPNLIRDVVFRNAKRVSQQELDEMTRDIRKGQPINPDSNKAAAREIQSFLMNARSCWWANVVLEEGCLATDHRVVFNVTDGPAVRVRSVQFVGAEGLAGADRLSDVVAPGGVFRLTRNGKDLSDEENNPAVGESAENEFAEMWRKFGLPLPEFLRPHVEDQGNLSDEQKLENHLKAIGYRHARVLRETVVSEDYHQVDLVFHISGGPRSKVEEITFSDNPVFTRAELTKVIRQKPGDWYSEEQAKQDAKALYFYIGRRGLRATMDVEIGESDVGGVNVAYKIQALEAPRIGQVFVVRFEPTMEQMRAGLPPWLQKSLDAEATHVYPFPAWPSWSEFEDFFLEPILGRFWEPECVRFFAGEQPKAAERAVEVDEVENVADPLTVLRQSTDMAQRAAALASLKEPLQNDGTQEEQDRYLTMLVRAATGKPARSWFDRQNANQSGEDADLLEPLIRLGEIRALAGYKDPRAAKALETVYFMQLPFSRQINSRIRCHALAALEKTGGPIARATLLRACADRRGSSPALLDAQIAHDETLTALRGLARFNDQEVLETLVGILEKEGNFALRQRAHMTLKTITGQELPPDPAAWHKFLGSQSNTTETDDAEDDPEPICVNREPRRLGPAGSKR